MGVCAYQEKHRFKNKKKEIKEERGIIIANCEKRIESESKLKKKINEIENGSKRIEKQNNSKNIESIPKGEIEINKKEIEMEREGVRERETEIETGSIEKKKEKIVNKSEEEKNTSIEEDCNVSEEINTKDKMALNKICGGCKENFQELWEKALKRHNEFRKKHGARNLELNPDLCEIAQSSAEKYSETDIENIYKIPPKLYKGDIVGENIAIIDKFNSTNFEDIINKWYEEKQNYEFDSNKYIENTGHFTQLIWRETKEIGFGKKINKGKMYFIAIYYPAGNIFKQFKNNVLKEQN